MLLLFYFFSSVFKIILPICYLLHHLAKKSSIIVCAFGRFETKRKRNETKRKPKNCLLKTMTQTRTCKHQTFRYIQSQTDTKMWLRYYLEQLFGVRWRKYNQRYTSRRKKYPGTEHDEPNVRFYKATATTDYSDCDCIDI